MRIEIFSLFPGAVDSFLWESLVGRARRDGVLDIRVHDLRHWADDPRHSVDDAPFGGGAGMVLAPGPVFAAVEAVEPARPLFLLSPSGERFGQEMAQRLAQGDGFSLLCGRYEGVDERIAEHLVDGAVSVGDYVLSGGEVAALVVVEAVGRLVPGVLGNPASGGEESFTQGLLEYPHYTRPAEFRGWRVPDVLTSGNHQAVAEWQHVQSLVRTLQRRPDLIAARGGLTEAEVSLLAKHGHPPPA